ncbi:MULTISPECIES: DUF6384 family protein [Pseudomonas]|uniref:Uncharacterized protein n=1 Tax=Pseudomonas fluorescens TaxID=294 RepID=A0A5E6V660_PSEFL|nr:MULTISPECIES: DUF6384 family protein [Pseudomonas]VVN10674.1 hypothetical protein PS652_03788 [Pseudomonas fluorescens]
MRSIPLSEQLGAMAFVDELRHQQMQVQEHLDLPKRRAEVAARIRAYYQSHNIAFDEALIDQGVRDFFARRLMFEAPPLSWRQKLLSKASMARSQLVKLVLAIIAAALITQCTRIVHDSGITIEIENSARDLRGHDEDVRSEIQLKHKQLEQWQQKALAQPDAAVSRILDQVRQTLPPLDQTFASDVPQFVHKTNRDSVKALVEKHQAQIKQARNALYSARSALSTVEGIYEQRDKLARLLAMPAYTEGLKPFPNLKELASSADQQLQQVTDSDTLKVAGNQVSKLDLEIDRIRYWLEQMTLRDQLQQRLQAMPLAAGDRAQLQALLAQANNSLHDQNVSQVRTQLQHLKQMLDFAALPLTMQIVDRTGVKSGVERCYDPAGCNHGEDTDKGKSWFLVVEATDAGGISAQVPVTSSETGNQRWTRLFAVRVSQAEYLKVKVDKLDDGHIDDRLIGSKAANSLTLRFNQRTTGNPDMIMDW